METESLTNTIVEQGRLYYHDIHLEVLEPSLDSDRRLHKSIPKAHLENSLNSQALLQLAAQENATIIDGVLENYKAAASSSIPDLSSGPPTQPETPDTPLVLDLDLPPASSMDISGFGVDDELQDTASDSVSEAVLLPPQLPQAATADKEVQYDLGSAATEVFNVDVQTEPVGNSSSETQTICDGSVSSAEVQTDTVDDKHTASCAVQTGTLTQRSFVDEVLGAKALETPILEFLGLQWNACSQKIQYAGPNA
ncbi:hypothetical protein HDU91_000104 [Kappamyces sp. JEL0680]|nr:hypothetical protein HDU91_000104 [Kappamyces sp. JEL0680]